jgi:hypothetical protein
MLDSVIDDWLGDPLYKRGHKPFKTHQIRWAQVTKHLPSKFPNRAQYV